MSHPETKRRGKRELIAEFFSANLGVSFGSPFLHGKFGSAVRTRISEINRDPAAGITVYNTVVRQPDGSEHSVYRAEVRQ